MNSLFIKFESTIDLKHIGKGNTNINLTDGVTYFWNFCILILVFIIKPTNTKGKIKLGVS